MGSLFQGDPQTATSYTTSSTETPKWMQDAIYNQIQVAQNLANAPYQPYLMPTVAEMSPLQQQAYQKVQEEQNAWAPDMNAASIGMKANAEAPGGAAAALPYQTQAASMSGLDAAMPWLNQAAGTSGVNAAQPYLQQAGQSSVANIQDYMNPYTTQVTDRIAELGARNLTENLLPGVSDSFVRAGSFGGTRMGEFGSRALRDTQDSILGQQSQALQAGYGQALGTSQADQARQAQLASTAGNLTQAQQAALSNIGQQTGALTQQQQQLLASLGSTTGQLTGADLTRQQSALSQMAGLAQTGQQMQTADTAALEAAGASQQANQQAKLTAAQQQYQQQLLYPQQQMDWLNTQIRGMAPITPQNTVQSGSTTGQTYSASPLSQLATGLYTYKGLQGLG